MGISPHRHARRPSWLPAEVEEVSPTSAPLVDAKGEYDNHPTCPYCRYSEQVPGGWKCRRHPPVVNVNRPGEVMFPIMQEDDWCGEHERE